MWGYWNSLGVLGIYWQSPPYWQAWLVPIVAGAVEMEYRRFFTWNVAGGVLWALGVTLVGYGTKIVMHTLNTSGGPVKYWRALRFWATSYSPKSAGGETTASGKKLRGKGQQTVAKTDRVIIAHVRALARQCGASLVLIHVADGFAARNLAQLDLHAELAAQLVKISHLEMSPIAAGAHLHAPLVGQLRHDRYHAEVFAEIGHHAALREATKAVAILAGVLRGLRIERKIGVARRVFPDPVEGFDPIIPRRAARPPARGSPSRGPSVSPPPPSR